MLPVVQTISNTPRSIPSSSAPTPAPILAPAVNLNSETKPHPAVDTFVSPPVAEPAVSQTDTAAEPKQPRKKSKLREWFHRKWLEFAPKLFGRR